MSDKPQPDPGTDTTDAGAEATLAAERAAVVELRELVVRRELELTQLQHEMLQFELRYTRMVAVRQIELDGIQDRITLRMAELRPQEPGNAERAEAVRRIREEAEVAGSGRRRRVAPADPAAPDEPVDRHRAKLLRRLFREVARRVHPDLAVDPESIEIRNELMREAREAYQRGDVEHLGLMFENYSDLDGGGEPERDRARLRQAIAQLHLRLRSIEEAIDAIRDGFLHHIMLREAELRAAEDRDLLAEMAEQLDQQIAVASDELAALTSDDGDQPAHP